MDALTKKAIANIDAAIANRPDDSLITLNDVLYAGDLRRVVEELKQVTFAAGLFMDANEKLGARLLSGREDKLVHVAGKKPAPAPKFANVSCSQCGCDFGPGDHGFSHCDNHSDRVAVAVACGAAQ